MTRPDPATQRMSHSEAQQSPCRGCAASCCTVLSLHDFEIRRLEDLDHAFYLLNFDRMELALRGDGSWRVHYRAPCTCLDPATRQCTVHGTPLQPHVCRRYSPYSCFYRRLFDSPETVDTLRIDRARLQVFASMLVFDGHRDIVSGPTVAALREAVGPMAEPDWSDTLGAPLLAEWEAAVRSYQPLRPLPQRRFADFDAPCTGCQAWCCTRLTFPHATPANVASIDHLRFCLGFPGVEVGLDERGAWTVVVRTRCRHLQTDAATGAGRCGVFGQPERPAACRLYDGSLCGYRAQFGTPRPARYLRLSRETFDVAAQMFVLDDNGYVLRRPGYAEIRQAIESRWALEGSHA